MTLHRSLALRIFLFSWLAYTVHWAPFLIRELFPAVTLARSGSLDVSEYLGWINDIFAGPRGGAYINNNPSASIAGAIPLAVAQPALDAVARWNEAHPQWKSLDSLDSSSVRKVVEARRELYFVLASLLTVAGLAAPFLRGRHAVPAREMWLILSHFVMAVLFCAANHYSWLQHTTGCRYLVIVVPGMLL